MCQVGILRFNCKQVYNIKRANAKEVFQCLLGLYKRTELRKIRCFKSVSIGSTFHFREGLDGGITKYRVFEVHWNIPDFLARLKNLKSGVRCWETVSFLYALTYVPDIGNEDIL